MGRGDWLEKHDWPIGREESRVLLVCRRNIGGEGLVVSRDATKILLRGAWKWNFLWR